MALATSPEYLTPPSPITGTPLSRAASAASRIAVSCGTPTPATMRVVQIEPRPDADLDRVGAGVDQRLRALARRHIAGDHRDLVGGALDTSDLLEHLLGMAVRGVDHEAIDARRHQQLGALEALVADRSGGGDAQAAVGVLGGVRMRRRLLDVLDGDEADAAADIVDDHQFLDTVQMQEPPRLLAPDPLADRHHLARHEIGHRLAQIVGEAHVAIGENPDQLRRLAVSPALDHRMPEIAARRMRASASASVASGRW